MTYIGNIQIPDNLFSEDKRNEGYFLRIPSYNTDVEKLIQKCVPISEKCGALINEKLKAPDANDISKCTEAMKNSFTVSTIYIINCLSSYLNIPGHQLGELPRNIRNTLEVLSQLGKTESVIKNTFVKYMFWIKTYLYSSLGSAINGCHPLVFYAGQMSLHEMLFFAALSDSGYDIMVLETSGDTYYKSIDKEGKYSSALFIPNGTSFPQNFSLKKIQLQIDIHSIFPKDLLCQLNKALLRHLQILLLRQEGITQRLSFAQMRGSAAIFLRILLNRSMNVVICRTQYTTVLSE